MVSSLDYETSVDLWSDIIAMEYPCRTIGPVLSQIFPLASAKAQQMGGFDRIVGIVNKLSSVIECFITIIRLQNRIT